MATMATASETATREIKASLQKLYGDEKFFDLTITCGNRIFKVHKAIVCSRSAVLRAHLNFKEGNDSVINLKAAAGDSGQHSEDGIACDDPEAVEAMIRHFYHSDYVEDDQALEAMSLDSHAKIFATATKYDVQSLKELSSYYFNARVEKCFPAKLQPSEIASAIRTVFTTTADSATELRDTCVGMLVRLEAEALASPEIDQAIYSTNGLAHAILKRAKDNAAEVARVSREPVHEFYCGWCNHLYQTSVLTGLRRCPNCDAILEIPDHGHMF